MERLTRPLPRNSDILDPNHLDYHDRLRFFEPISGRFVYPPETIIHYAERYGVKSNQVTIRSNGLIFVPRDLDRNLQQDS